MYPCMQVITPAHQNTFVRSLVPDGSHYGAGKFSFSDLAAVLLGDYQARLDIALPDDDCAVVLMSYSDQVSSLVQRELARRPATRWRILQERQCPVLTDRPG